MLYCAVATAQLQSCLKRKGPTLKILMATFSFDLLKNGVGQLANLTVQGRHL